MTNKLKVGDRVRCTNSDNYAHVKKGSEYTVVSVAGLCIALDLPLWEGKGREYPVKHFELVEPPPAAPTPYKFKKGDRVRCVDRGGNTYIRNGLEYTVSDVNNALDEVALSEVPGYSYPSFRFELIPTTPKVFRILRKGIQWGTTEYGSVEDAEAAIQKSAPVGEPFVIVELSTVKAVTVKRVLEAA